MTTVETALTSLNAKLTTLQAKHQGYMQTMSNANIASLLQQNNTLTANIGKMQMELRELNREEEMLDKQFLDTREVVTPQTALSRIGLATVQDWALAAFFFSFSVFCLVILSFAASMSKYPARVFLVGIPVVVILAMGMGLVIRILG